MIVIGKFKVPSPPHPRLLYYWHFQDPLSLKVSRQEYWSGLLFPSPGDLPNQGSNPGLLHFRLFLSYLSHLGSPSLSWSYKNWLPAWERSWLSLEQACNSHSNKLYSPLLLPRVWKFFPNPRTDHNNNLPVSGFCNSLALCGRALKQLTVKPSNGGRIPDNSCGFLGNSLACVVPGASLPAGGPGRNSWGRLRSLRGWIEGWLPQPSRDRLLGLRSDSAFCPGRSE